MADWHCCKHCGCKRHRIGHPRKCRQGCNDSVSTQSEARDE